MRFQLFADSVGDYMMLEDDDLHHLTGWGTTTASSPRLLDNKHDQNRHAGRKPIPWFPRKTQLQSAVCSVQASETSLRSVDLQHPHAPGLVHAPTPGEDDDADDLCCWSSLEPPAASATLFPVAREPPCRPSFRSFPRCLKWLFRTTRTASRSSSPGPYGKQRTLSTSTTSRDSRFFPLNRLSPLTWCIWCTICSTTSFLSYSASRLISWKRRQHQMQWRGCFPTITWRRRCFWTTYSSKDG